MAELNKDGQLRRGESHIKALSSAIEGSVLDYSWQTEDQVTVDVPTQKIGRAHV